MRKPVIAANWKMHKTHLDGIHFVEALRNHLDDGVYGKVDIVICPPFTALRSVQTTVDGDSLDMAIGAQDMHWEDSGAFTGEVSPGMLSKLGVSYVIVGHSERREYFGETDELVNRKVLAALSHEMSPILCVGETLAEYEAGSTERKVATQVEAGLSGVSPEQLAQVVIAYEPIWAIGTGKTASSEEAQGTIKYIRSVVESLSPTGAAAIRIQYGGSVKPGNIAELMAQPDIDGALVGGASLEAQDFARILHFQANQGQDTG